MVNNYYQRFQIITHLFFFRWYLQWAYKQGIDDAKKLEANTFFTEKNFSCLLCGVSGEITAEEFIKFVITKNPKAQITIIDMGEKQITSIKKLVVKRYKKYSINIKQINALDLHKHFKQNTFNWIETDGFIEYFNKENLQKLLQEWRIILKKDGFITTRDFASIKPFGFIIDTIRYWFIKYYLTLPIYIHTKKQLDNIFKQNKFKFISRFTPLPTYRRYALITS